MVLLLRILEEVVRAGALKDATRLLGLVVATETCRYGWCRLRQGIHPSERKWRVEWDSRCSCAKVTRMLKIFKSETSTQEIIREVLILVIERIIDKCTTLLVRSVMHPESS